MISAVLTGFYNYAGIDIMNFDRIERWYFAPESNSGAGLGNLEVSEETEMNKFKRIFFIVEYTVFNLNNS